MSNAYEIREDGAGYWCIVHESQYLAARLTLAQAIKQACCLGRTHCQSTAQTTYVQMVMPGSSITLALFDGPAASDPGALSTEPAMPCEVSPGGQLPLPS